MRVLGMGAKVLENLGVTTSGTLTLAEVKSRLLDGSLDAAEYGPPAMDYGLNLHELPVNYYYLPAWQTQSLLTEVLVNKTVWENLGAKRQQLFQKACYQISTERLVDLEQEQAKAVELISQREGLQVKYFSKEVLQALKLEWKKIVAERSNVDATFKEVVQSIEKFKASKWFKNAYLSESK